MHKIKAPLRFKSLLKMHEKKFTNEWSVQTTYNAIKKKNQLIKLGSTAFTVLTKQTKT